MLFLKKLVFFIIEFIVLLYWSLDIFFNIFFFMVMFLHMNWVSVFIFLSLNAIFGHSLPPLSPAQPPPVLLCYVFMHLLYLLDSVYLQIALNNLENLAVWGDMTYQIAEVARDAQWSEIAVCSYAYTR